MYSSFEAIRHDFLHRLSNRYDERERGNIFHESLEFVCGFTRTDFVLKRQDNPGDEVSQRFSEILNRLESGEPLQQITERAWFYDNWFYVNRNVLIPRPETEELVRWILENHDTETLKLLDIGTGSGCIPISLQIQQPRWEIWACDITQEALEVASKNNKILVQSKVQMFQADALKSKDMMKMGMFDVLVSNPPYIPRSESNTMEENVKDFEPKLALFVDDNDPLIFYKSIVDIAANQLSHSGWIYFEIHESFGEEIKELLQRSGFDCIELKQDFQSKDRMIRCRKL